MRDDVRRLNTLAKLLERIVWLSPVQNGLPVAFRARTNVRFPTIKVNRFRVTVVLPIELTRFIPSLARFMRLWRSRNGKPKTKRKPKPLTFDDIVALTTNNTSQKKVKAMKEPHQKEHKNDAPNSRNNGKSEKFVPLLSVTCSKCQRTVEILHGWLSLTVRCSACGAFFSEPIEPKVH